MNIYYAGTGDYVYLSVSKKTGPGNAPTVTINTGISAVLVATGSPTPSSGWNPVSFANGSPAIDISSLAVGTYDVYVRITDPDTGRFPIEKAGTIQIQ